MSDENIIDVDQNETDTCEEITDTDTISGEDKSENISTNEATGTTEDIDADYSIDEEPGESSEDTSCSEANDATTVSGATASQVAETAGSKRWNEYTSSTDLDDTDELMILDTSAKANKRTLLSKLADYVLGKLADKVFEKLETQNKTVIGALNELNSNKVSNDGKWINLDNTSIFEYFKPNGKTIIVGIYNASEYPSSFTSEDKWCMVLKGTERIVLFTEAGAFIAKASNGVWNKKWTQL